MHFKKYTTYFLEYVETLFYKFSNVYDIFER